MLLTMTKNYRGANDGICTKEYIAGNTYDFSETLGRNFLSLKVAKKPKEDAPSDQNTETEKSEKADLKNKAVQTGDLNNKSGEGA